MSRIFAILTVLLLALAVLPAEKAPGRAGGGEQFGGGGAPSSDGGSGGGGERQPGGGGGGGGGFGNLPGLLAVVVLWWWIAKENPLLGLAILAGAIALIYAGVKIDDKLRRRRRRLDSLARAADEGPSWPKQPKRKKAQPVDAAPHAEAVVAAAVAAMLADGRIAEAEYALLQRLAARHGVSREALDRLVHSLEMGALPASEVTRGVPRDELLAVVRDVIAADGVADPKELALAEALARKLA